MLKRLLRDSLVRDAQIAKPWVVKSHLALKYNIPSSPPDDVAEKNEKIRDGKLAKRKKAPKEEDELAAKRQKKNEEAGKQAKAVAPKDNKRPIKYPIEDLDLDPMSIHDGRVLRRVLTDVPPLPPKPAPHRQLPVEPTVFERFLMIWNMLNIFAFVFSPFA
jgi:bromodomain adjacent to zinc finger domain protein 1A